MTMYLNLSNSDRYKPRRKSGKKPAVVYEKFEKPKFKPLRADPARKPFRRDEGVVYKSRDMGTAVAEKPVRTEYTGTLVKGISTMHKSNAVPIINEQEAIDIANMRRN